MHSCVAHIIHGNLIAAWIDLQTFISLTLSHCGNVRNICEVMIFIFDSYSWDNNNEGVIGYWEMNLVKVMEC